MGAVGAQEGEVSLPGQRDIVGVAARATHQGRVFDTAHRSATAEAGGFHRRAHFAPPAITVAACFTAATMLT